MWLQSSNWLLNCWLIDWLIDSFIDWLIDLLIHWFIDLSNIYVKLYKALQHTRIYESTIKTYWFTLQLNFTDRLINILLSLKYHRNDL